MVNSRRPRTLIFTAVLLSLIFLSCRGLPRLILSIACPSPIRYAENKSAL